MTIGEFTAAASARLATTPTAALDVTVLLADELGRDRGWILAHPEHRLPATAERRLDRQIEQRIAHQPLAYIRGRTEFYGRDFLITPAVLEPRPESEAMIDELKAWVSRQRQQAGSQLVDVGTGSGALAITAKLELPGLSVAGCDIDPACLEVAHQNAARHGADINWFKGDMLTGRQGFDFVLANLPYVPDDHRLNEAAMNEPQRAIFGGADGLDFYRRLFGQLAAWPTQPAAVFTESLPFQHSELTNIAKRNHFRLAAENDFILVFEPC